MRSFAETLAEPAVHGQFHAGGKDPRAGRWRAAAFGHPRADMPGSQVLPADAGVFRGGPDPLLLAALDRGQFLAAVRAKMRGAATRVAFALPLDGQHDLLGDSAEVWCEMAAGPDGAAVSHLLVPLALPVRGRPRTGDSAQNPAAGAPEDIARVVDGGAGDRPAVRRARRRRLLHPVRPHGRGVAAPGPAQRSAEHTPDQASADKAAERAAAHPRSPDALLLAVHLLTRPGRAYDADVRRHARVLLHAAAALPEAGAPLRRLRLRRALVEAGELDLAQTTAAG